MGKKITMKVAIKKFLKDYYESCYKHSALLIIVSFVFQFLKYETLRKSRYWFGTR